MSMIAICRVHGVYDGVPKIPVEEINMLIGCNDPHTCNYNFSLPDYSSDYFTTSSSINIDDIASHRDGHCETKIEKDI